MAGKQEERGRDNTPLPVCEDTTLALAAACHQLSSLKREKMPQAALPLSCCIHFHFSWHDFA